MDKYIMDKYILELSTFPALSVGLGADGMTRFRKELIKVGSYIKESTKQKLDVTVSTLNKWVTEFQRWVANGNKIPIPLNHSGIGKPEKNQGWVTSLFVEGNSLYGIMELAKPELALTTDVSICIEKQVVDGKGNKYENPITHIALCTNPVVPGLENFIKLSLEGEDNMEFIKKLAAKLKLSKDGVTEEDILLALESKPQVKNVVDDVVIVDPVVKLISENREIKLSNLVTAGLITPAIKDKITEKYVKVEDLALSLSKKQDDGFDFLYDALSQNKPSELKEQTGIQSFELSNKQANNVSPVMCDVYKRRAAAGLKD